MESKQSTSSFTVPFNESNSDENMKRKRKVNFKKDGLNISTSYDADESADNECDLTPGSLEIWLDLPEEIKYDPLLAAFKQRYDEQHGKFEPESLEGDKTIFDKKTETPSPDNNCLFPNEISSKEVSVGLMEPIDTHDEKRKSLRKKLKIIGRIIKLSSFVAFWIFITTSLLMNTERSDVELHTAIKEGTIKEYKLNTTKTRVKLLVTLNGPFDRENYGEINGNLLHVWLHRTSETEGGRFEQNSTKWLVKLQADNAIDFSPSVTETRTLVLDHDHLMFHSINSSKDVNGTSKFTNWDQLSVNDTKVSLKMATSGQSIVPLTISYQLDPLDEDEGIIYAALLLLLLYLLIIFELVSRCTGAMACSALGVGALAAGGARPGLRELAAWLDVETLLLLFSMMLLVALLADTGLFDYLAVAAFEVTGGRTWPLINCLCLFTAVFSTFLDNVTTVLLMTPVTIRLCEVMELNPVPILMSMVIFSNVGGAATPVGDPPNVIIATHPAVIKANLNFANFTMHMGLGILLVSAQTYLQLRFMFRDMNKLRHDVPKHVQGLRQEIAVWRRAAASLSSYSRDEDIVRKALEKKVEKLNAALAKLESGKATSKIDPKFSSTLANMKEKYRIRDKPLLVKSIICLSFVIIIFFLHAIPELQRLSLGWTALLGALLLLLIAEKDDIEPILARIEWSTLLFFAALFVMMEILAKLGLILWIGKVTENIIMKVSEESRLAVAILLILWVSGLASALVDNIPLTTMMIRVTHSLSLAPLSLPLAPLAAALSFGACLGGNGTLIGASANVVCAGVAEQHGYRISFLRFLRVGFPVMIGNLTVASVYLLMCHCVFQWH